MTVLATMQLILTLLLLADEETKSGGRLVATALRCYTDVGATKTHSTECGISTGCVKIYINSEEMLMRRHSGTYGLSPSPTDLPPRYQGDPVLFRGCFVLAVPDRCYDADNGLSYCWCSTKDLCNAATPVRWQATTSAPMTVLAGLSVATWLLTAW